MYLVDSSAWIDLLKKHDDRLIPYLESREVQVTDIVLFELLSGLPKSGHKKLLEQMSLFSSLPLTREAVLNVASVTFVMRKRGYSPQTTDLLIAGIALTAKATLIHKDKDFENIRKFCDLQTVNFLKRS